MTRARDRHRHRRRVALLGLLTASLGGLFATAIDPAAAAAGGGATCCAIVELRQYTLHPGHFAAFARMFEDEFLEPLETAGMTVIGQFRDLDDPDRFVWLRGFRDMPSRAVTLAAFYDGALWKSRRNAANDHFTDTDNVLLLHPAGSGAGIDLGGLRRPAPGASDTDRGLVVATVYSLAAGSAGDFPAYFDRDVRPALAAAGIDVAATFETEASPNNFPRLPVREGEHVFVWIARFADRAAGDAALKRLSHAPQWQETIAPALQQRFKAPPQVLRLAPTPRSLLRG